MTEAQHSIGEWEYDESTGQVDVPDGTICTGITWRPNGYLIEAAPALLKALEEAHDHMQSLATDMPPGADQNALMMRVHDAGRTAARARGTAVRT